MLAQADWGGLNEKNSHVGFFRCTYMNGAGGNSPSQAEAPSFREDYSLRAGAVAKVVGIG